jgi:hypothetical protein
LFLIDLANRYRLTEAHAVGWILIGICKAKPVLSGYNFGEYQSFFVGSGKEVFPSEICLRNRVHPDII